MVAAYPTSDRQPLQRGCDVGAFSDTARPAPDPIRLATPSAMRMTPSYLLITRQTRTSSQRTNSQPPVTSLPRAVPVDETLDAPGPWRRSTSSTAQAPSSWTVICCCPPRTVLQGANQAGQYHHHQSSRPESDTLRYLHRGRKERLVEIRGKVIEQIL